MDELARVLRERHGDEPDNDESGLLLRSFDENRAYYSRLRRWLRRLRRL
jgi:hypothetical protein